MKIKTKNKRKKKNKKKNMIKHQPVHFVIVNCVVIVFQLPNTVGLVWKAAPDEVVNVQQGSSIALHWHYEMEDNEIFLSSEFVSNDRKSKGYYLLASRYEGESRYSYLSNKKHNKFTISGKNNVILTLFSAELRSSNSGYCCRVNWGSHRGRRREERCAMISIYVLPRIARHIPQLYCKQDDLVKLQCNATGYPEPRARWIHRDTNKIIADSFVTSLNITGKIMEGSYCCDVKNQFGREITCTTVKVTEYGPMNTILSSNRGYIIKNKTFRIQCQADASPPPRYLFIQNKTLIHQSGDGIYIGNNITGKEAITISCIPWNKYGQGPTKTIILEMYDFPQFTENLRLRYNMTTSSITITCSATGNPTPNITWTKGDTKEIVSTKEYYNVPYVKCDNKELVYYCHANNVLGCVRSKEIIVHVMTENNDHGKSPQDTLWQKKAQYKVDVMVLGPLFIVSLLVNHILVIYVVWERRKVLKDSKYKENKRELETNSDVRESMNDNEAHDMNSTNNVISKRVLEYEQVDLDDPVLQRVLISDADRNVSNAAKERNNPPPQTFALVHSVISKPLHKTISNTTLGELDEQNGILESISAIQSSSLRKETNSIEFKAEVFPKRPPFEEPMYQSIQVTPSNYASLSLSTKFPARNTSLPAAKPQNGARGVEFTLNISEYQELSKNSAHKPYQSLDDFCSC